MIDWKLPPDLQEKFNQVQAQTRKLQEEFGITPMTIEQRSQAYQAKKKQEELIKQTLGARRPPPKWKV